MPQSDGEAACHSSPARTPVGVPRPRHLYLSWARVWYGMCVCVTVEGVLGFVGDEEVRIVALGVWRVLRVSVEWGGLVSLYDVL